MDEINVPGDLDRAFSTRDISSSLSESDKYAENLNYLGNIWSLGKIGQISNYTVFENIGSVKLDSGGKYTVLV